MRKLSILLISKKKPKTKVPSEYQIPSSSITHTHIYIKWIILVITGQKKVRSEDLRGVFLAARAEYINTSIAIRNY